MTKYFYCRRCRNPVLAHLNRPRERTCRQCLKRRAEARAARRAAAAGDTGAGPTLVPLVPDP
ncbi:MAG TPA: hypothetical protein VFR55_08395 [Dehalococcoidia bacterium]|nr:hypothetical protein [Dehalococcoidia bacterium]